MRLTLPEFRDRLLSLARDGSSVMERATGKAALHVKKEIVAAAMLRVRRTPKARPGWVKYDVFPNADGAVGKVYLRGGFAHLAEKGSYKKPGGYTIPRPGRRRRGTGWRGPFHHPAIPAQPFFRDGWERAKPSVTRIYYDAEVESIRQHFS